MKESARHRHVEHGWKHGQNPFDNKFDVSSYDSSRFGCLKGFMHGQNPFGDEVDVNSHDSSKFECLKRFMHGH
jgi:hypothetical protein